MSLPEIVTTARRDGDTVFTNPFDFRGDFGYDQELLGRLGLDVFDDDIIAQDILNEEQMQAAGKEFMLRQQAEAGFQYDPNRDASPQLQLLGWAGDIEEQLRDLHRDGFITSEAATNILKEMLEREGVKGKDGGEVRFDPAQWEERGHTVRQDSGGLLKLPDLSSLESKTVNAADVIGTTAGAAATVIGTSGEGGGGGGGTAAPAAAQTIEEQIRDYVGREGVTANDVVREMDAAGITVQQVADALGVPVEDVQSQYNEVKGITTPVVTPPVVTAPVVTTPVVTAPVVTPPVVTTPVVSGNEGLGTGGGLLGGGRVNPDGTPAIEGTGPVAVRTPDQQWQDILNDPDINASGAIEAAILIYGNSPEGVAAVVDAANARDISAEDIAANSGFTLADILAAATASGKVFTRETGITEGPAGLNGRDGIDGRDGRDGATGATGAAGRDGIDGIAGIDGRDGRDGRDGATGATGAKGDVGATGATGATGERGERGERGEVGPLGPMGPVGATGATGATGAKGDKGDKGDIGATGATGATGERGERGERGEAGADNLGLGGLFQAALTPQPQQQSIVQDIFNPELFKLKNRLPLDINSTLFGGLLR